MITQIFLIVNGQNSLRVIEPPNVEVMPKITAFKRKLENRRIHVIMNDNIQIRDRKNFFANAMTLD